MKKYFILGMIVIALAVMAVFFLRPNLSADVRPGPEPLPSFYGTAGADRTVTAALQIFPYTVYTTIAKPNNTYSFRSNILHGPYIVGDGCQTFNRSYEGTPVRVDICYPHDGLECNCW